MQLTGQDTERLVRFCNTGATLKRNLLKLPKTKAEIRTFINLNSIWTLRVKQDATWEHIEHTADNNCLYQSFNIELA